MVREVAPQELKAEIDAGRAPRMLDVREGWELEISRLAGAQTEMPLVRRIGNMFFARLLSVVGRANVSDSASGMRVFRKSTLALLSPLPDGLNLTPVMSTRAVHERIRVVERPIPSSDRVGESKLSVAGDGLTVLAASAVVIQPVCPVKLSTRRSPLCSLMR